MKFIKNLPIIGVAVAFSSCGALDKLQRPITNGSYNPLDAPGTRVASTRSNFDPNDPLNAPGQGANTNEHGFKNGDVVEVAISNTALFKSVPKPGDRYSRVLKVGDTLRVVGGEKDFVKVVTQSGETGYVSSVMVVSQGYLSGAGPLGAGVTQVGANETPLVPDVAPEPEIKGLGTPDPSPIVPPTPVPSITDPVLIDPDPTPVPAIPKLVEPAAPALPDTPALPAEPTGPAPDPEVPGLPE